MDDMMQPKPENEEKSKIQPEGNPLNPLFHDESLNKIDFHTAEQKLNETVNAEGVLRRQEEDSGKASGDKFIFDEQPILTKDPLIDETLADQRTKGEQVEKGLRTRKQVIQIVAVSVLFVFAIQLFLGTLLIAGIGAFNPGFTKRLSDFIAGPTQSEQLSQKVSEKITNIQIERTSSPVAVIAAKVGPSVVGIKVAAKSVRGYFFGGGESNPEGSGIIIRKDGYIMTNYHVLSEALSQTTNKIITSSKIEVILPNLKDKPYAASLVGKDERTDLAVLKIDVTNLPAIEMGDSDTVKVGDLAVAIGNPGGIEFMGSVTAGIISGINRTIPIEDGKELKLLQTDAAINPGNSGGALVNEKGQLIGVNTAKIGTQGFEGLGFAIPINKAKQITDSLIEFKYVKGRPLFGIVTDPRYTEELAQQYDLPVGVLVSEVTPFTGAYDAGIRPKDIVTKFDGKLVKNVDELNDIKAKRKPGETVPVEIYRDGETKKFNVKLTEDKR